MAAWIEAEGERIKKEKRTEKKEKKFIPSLDLYQSKRLNMQGKNA